jgi:arginine/lysine/ornithine decarboxylase
VNRPPTTGRSPLARGHKGNVRIAVGTNSTYDGLCYKAEKIKVVVADPVDALHFDEAWHACVNGRLVVMSSMFDSPQFGPAPSISAATSLASISRTVSAPRFLAR